MLRHFFVVGFRNLVRNKTFSVINICGLTLGIACSMAIFLWVQEERRVDAFHTNGQQLYQVYERNFYDGQVQADYPTQGLLADELKKQVPEIAWASGMDYAAAPGSQNTLEAQDKIAKWDGRFAGEDFFNMFSYPILSGDASTALNEPISLAISRNIAEFYFGSPEMAIGQTIRFDNHENLRVSAVFENIPAASSIKFDFLKSWKAYVAENDWVHNWGNTSPSTFIQLRSDADPDQVETRIRDFVYRYMPKNEGFRIELALQPYGERYLHSTFHNGYIQGGRIEYVRLFTILGIFLIIIACVNFMNLATARAGKRAREVGVRKVVGAARFALFRQFTGEAVLLSLLATMLAILLLGIMLPAFNMLTGKQMTLPLTAASFWCMSIGIALLAGMLAGSYPAVFLAGLKPVGILKGNFRFGRGSILLRKALVTFQFSMAVLLIIGMLIVNQQVGYIQQKNLGYDRSNLVYIPIEGDMVNNYETFKDEALRLTGVEYVSKMRNSPTVISHHYGDIGWEGKDPKLVLPFADAVVGYDFIKTLDLKLVAGRDFSKDFGTDSMGFLVNETAARRMGYADPVGKNVWWGSHRGSIIGVIKDFHFSSMHTAIEPLIVRLDENWSWGTILVRMVPGKTQATMGSLEALYKSLNPKFPFSFQFSDQEYDKLYRSEQVISRLSGIFTFLAIFISCMGLFGLATLTAEQRRKEIGIRKTIGASVLHIIKLVTADLIRPVGLAFVLATPIAWLVMNRWLQNYAYKIDIHWFVFAWAGIAIIGIAMLTVCWQIARAAMANPVKSLRTE